MTQRKIKYIDGGSPQYWQERKQGFRLVHEAERAAKRLENAPMYLRGRWDEEYGDYEPVENLAPVEAMDEAIQAIEADETAVSILVAQRRTHIGGCEIKAVVKALLPDTD